MSVIENNIFSEFGLDMFVIGDYISSEFGLNMSTVEDKIFWSRYTIFFSLIIDK